MHGVVSLLDTNHNQLVEKLWTELENRFNVRGDFATKIPHFTYHIADEYDFSLLEQVLTTQANNTKPFSIKTTGLGVFTGANPIIYIPLVRPAHLTQLHQTFWDALAGFCNGRHPYYAPDIWMPHITLGHHDITPTNLSPIVQWLNQQNLTWEISITNFAILRDPGDSSHNLLQRFDFAAH